MKYIEGDLTGMIAGNRSLDTLTNLQHKFLEPWRVGAYVLAFVFFSTTLLHGFASAFQSMGSTIRRKLQSSKNLENIYAYLIPVGFSSLRLASFITYNILDMSKLDSKVPEGPIKDKWTIIRITLMLLTLPINVILMLSLLVLV